MTGPGRPIFVFQLVTNSPSKMGRNNVRLYHPFVSCSFNVQLEPAVCTQDTFLRKSAYLSDYFRSKDVIVNTMSFNIRIVINGIECGVRRVPYTLTLATLASA